MMPRSDGITLAKNYGTLAPTTPVQWNGGRAVLVVTAAAYATTVNLEVQGPDGATWIKLNASTIAANSVAVYDCPAGQYRINPTGGTLTGLYANLVACPTA